MLIYVEDVALFRLLTTTSACGLGTRCQGLPLTCSPVLETGCVGNGTGLEALL